MTIPPRVGDRIQLLANVFVEGEKGPCKIASLGDLMHVRKIRGFNVLACHNERDKATMLIQKGEYEIWSRAEKD